MNKFEIMKTINEARIVLESNPPEFQDDDFPSNFQPLRSEPVPMSRARPIRGDENLGGAGRRSLIGSINKALDEAPDHVLLKVNRFTLRLIHSDL